MSKQIIPTTEEHILELSQTMRVADVEEIWAARHSKPYDALKRGVSMSNEAFTGLWDDKVVCIFGVAQHTPFTDEGVPWLLASDLVEKTSHTFLRVNRIYTKEIKKRYSRLENYVDCRNTESIKWLKWLGFKLDPPKPYGPDKLPFCRFEFKRDEGG
jgi:hypothetical protein|tara:strand:- start:318 stop:788 length:471 start_codon:yes stop_codon:yes gene_type:complete